MVSSSLDVDLVRAGLVKGPAGGLAGGQGDRSPRAAAPAGAGDAARGPPPAVDRRGDRGRTGASQLGDRRLRPPARRGARGEARRPGDARRRHRAADRSLRRPAPGAGQGRRSGALRRGPRGRRAARRWPSSGWRPRTTTGRRSRARRFSPRRACCAWRSATTPRRSHRSGRAHIGPEVESLIAALAESFPNQRFGEWRATARRMVGAGARFGDAFARQTVALLGARAPLMLDSMLPELKSAERPLLATADRALAARSKRLMPAAEERIVGRGFELQVAPQRGASPLFLLRDGARRRIEWSGDGGFRLRGAPGREPAEPVATLLALLAGDPGAGLSGGPGATGDPGRGPRVRRCRSWARARPPTSRRRRRSIRFSASRLRGRRSGRRCWSGRQAARASGGARRRARGAARRPRGDRHIGSPSVPAEASSAAPRDDAERLLDGPARAGARARSDSREAVDEDPRHPPRRARRLCRQGRGRRGAARTASRSSASTTCAWRRGPPAAAGAGDLYRLVRRALRRDLRHDAARSADARPPPARARRSDRRSFAPRRSGRPCRSQSG